MHFTCIFSLGLFSLISRAAPISSETSTAIPPTASQLNDPTFGPIPGQTDYYTTYRGKKAPFPALNATPILNTTSGPNGIDDVLFQNLLSAEWIVFSFYQQGVETFNKSSFTDLGFPDTTYDRVQEIRDNEAGHLRIFQDSISNNNVKPGPCSYDYEFGTDALQYLALQETIEISSMSFLSGLALQAQLDANKGALMAVGQTEARHEAWALIDIWKVSPFAGASDTSFPYANQILDLTNEFVIPGSCPPENPPYPTPNQHLPQINTVSNTNGFAPGDTIKFEFSFGPSFVEGTEYYAVYSHGVFNISVPFDTQTNLSTIPKEFESRGMIVAVVANEIGAPSAESVLAGPLLLFEQPEALNTLTP